MRSRRSGLPELAALGVAAAGTGWLATLSWRGFTQDPGGYLLPLLLVAVVVVVTGTTLRRLHLAGGWVLLGQLVLGVVTVSTLLTGSPLPVGSAFPVLVDALATSVANAQQFRAPVPAEGSIDPLLVLGGWVCLLLVDGLAVTMRRVPLAGLPLLAIYSVPVGVLGGGVDWWVFVLTAVGFLLMLHLQHSDTVARWGRNLEGRDAPLGGSSTVRASAGAVGAAATAAAVVAPILVPTLSLGVFGFGPGDGEGSDISVVNPMTDLRRDLRQSENVPLLRVTTDAPDPSYLRIAALTRFSGNEWSTGDRDIPQEQQASGTLPLPELDPSVGRTQRDYRIVAQAAFRSRWLPTQVPATRIEAAGDWRYDLATLDFLTADEDLDTAGLAYTFSSLDLDLDARALAASPSSAGEVDSSLRDLPADLPAIVDELALEVTREFPSRYEKAVALQDWFRRDGGFEYELANAPVGNGSDTLSTFLTEGEDGRTGYCEQFASAMAAMARSLGIPARVAVGFLEPRRIGPRTFEYSTDDLHAWPELYFSGAGWVRFEPTPGERAQGVPAYTAQDLPQQPDAQPSGQPGATPGGPAPSTGEDPRLDEGTPLGETSGSAEGGFPWPTVLVSLAVVVLLAALVLLPGAVRRRQASARLTGAPEPAWEELAATAQDLGVPWPVGRSPRETRTRLLDHLGPTAHDTDTAGVRPPRGPDVAPEAVAALDRLVLALERLRYSREQHPGETEVILADTRTVGASLAGGVEERTRRRARWWPASVLPWRRPQVAPVTDEPVLLGQGSMVDRVG